MGAIFVLIATYAVFRLSPIHTVFDSRFEMLFSQELLWHHRFGLEARNFPELQSHTPGKIYQRRVELTYHLVQQGERFYYLFPPGGVILSMPYVALANLFRISTIDQNGIYDERGDTQIQKGLAALLMAGFSAVIFLTSRLILPFRWSLLVTAATAFGTQVWSTASRAVWSHTWGIFILSFVLWMILRAETKQARLRPVLLGTCLSWLYFTRPPFSISIGGIVLYVAIYHRKIFLPLVATGLIWLGGFIAYSEYLFGRILPIYYQEYRFEIFSSFGEGLLGILISPSRGLLVYVPVLFLVAYLLIRYRANLRSRLVVLAVGVFLAYLIVVGGFPVWWGGHCYGARLLTDLVPWLALLAMLALEARLQWHEQNRERDSLLRVRTEWSFAGSLLVCSILLNGIAAFSTSFWWWNTWPDNIDRDPKRLWDWKHPQFLGVPKDAIARKHESGH